MHVFVRPAAKKPLEQIPVHVARKFEYWVDLLETVGLREARRFKGFHDEPLHGKRAGQRSVRLSKAYRIIYLEIEGQVPERIEVLEVSKHDY
jgi:toxin HigB-1